MHCPGFAHQGGFHAILPGGWQVYPRAEHHAGIDPHPKLEKSSRRERFKTKEEQRRKGEVQ
jgi:hypothetical protein